MKFFITLSKRHLFIITAALIAALLTAGSIYSATSGKIDGSTNASRVGYIRRLGYHVNETAVSVKEITIPQDFGQVYAKYNELQKKAGFDLADHKGEKATVYCYELSFDKGVNVHLIVSDSVVIGGDVSQVKLDGEMKPFLKNDGY